MVVIQACPRDLWDPTTRFLQHQVEFRPRLGTLEAMALGTLLIRWENVPALDRSRITYFVLIFGITCGGLVPWCYLSPARGFNGERYQQMSLGPREQADYFQHPQIDNYLEDEFAYRVDPFSISTDLEASRRHVHICDDLQLVTVAELKIVSGKEVCLRRQRHKVSGIQGIGRLLGSPRSD
ncbi:hypothetical protein F5882DRAFT_421895 [Hyaloscypha sp. PMI_1271]|nr:hypothetical protein F5882DRAFT_421895 [Hyaloscypha sp. PMI_1271]